MKVVADQNIPFVKEAFKDFGEIILVSGREIKNALLKDADVLLVRSVTKVNKDLLDGSKVKFIATATIGIDHIDISYLKENKIGFASAPGSNADSVAEYITSAILNLSIKYNFDLNKIKLGIIGVGNVGSRVNKRAGILGITTLLNDPPKKRETNDRVYMPLDEVLSNSDIVTVHVPLNKNGEDATYRLISKNFIQKMKKGAILFNTSRGNVMEESEVRNAKGYLNDIILDVWENEPAINIDTLKIAYIGTPHIAGYSYDGKVNGTEMIYRAACDFFNMKKTWDKTGYVKPERELIIDLTNSANVMFDAINNAYPVNNDSRELRKISDVAPEGQGKYFDDLRKNYPKRREFFNYTLIVNKNTDKKIVNNLILLGFKVKEK